MPNRVPGKSPSAEVVVLVSSETEWQMTKSILVPSNQEMSPLGEHFRSPTYGAQTLFFHGGWGKIAAAASTQHVIDRWRPPLLVNLGTCGGFASATEVGDTILVERTVVYDIVERMGDFAEAIESFSTNLDLSWLDGEPPTSVRRGTMVSGDRDLDPSTLQSLEERYDAVAGDWESGAIAWVAHRNDTRCLILRGVSDVVSADGGEAYGDFALFEARTRDVMRGLLADLPLWLQRAFRGSQSTR